MKMIKTTLLSIAAVFCIDASAIEQVNVLIPKITWDFEVKYGLLNQEPVRLSSSEQSIANKLKPLLNNAKYADAWQILKSVNTSESSAALAQAKAQIAVQLSNYKEAVKAYHDALNKRPDLLPSHRGLAVSFLKLNQTEKAIEHLSKALQLGDQDSSLFAQLAFLHMQNQQPAAAISGFRQALFYEPYNKSYIEGLIWALSSANNLNEANALIEQQIDKDPKATKLWLRLGQLQLQQGLEKEALASLDMALRLGDKSTANQMLTAQLHLRYGSAIRATELFKLVLQSGDKQYLDAVLDATYVMVNDESNEQSNAMLKNVKKYGKHLTKSQRSKVLTQEAIIFGSKQKPNKAIKLLEKAVKADGTNGQALIALGKLLLENNALDRAELYFTRAQALDLYKEQAMLFNAQIAANMSNYQRAIELLSQVVADNPSRHDIYANIKQLKRLKMSK